MQSFPNMSLFVYNIWWMILKKAAIWMEIYEFQRMNKKSIKIVWHECDEESLHAIRSLNW